MKNWVAFTYLLKSRYMAISKGSLVSVNGEQYVVKRIDRVILLDEACEQPNTVQLLCRGIKTN
jgi:hypothetical protein